MGSLNITRLPHDLKIGAAKGLQIYDYRSDKNISKSKIILEKHTISFLRIGIKELISQNKNVRVDHQHFLMMKAGNCLMSESTLGDHRRYHSVLLFFSPENVNAFIKKFGVELDSTQQMNAFNTFLYDDFIQNYVRGLEHILLLPIAIQDKILQAKFEELLIYLISKNGTSFLNSFNTFSDSRVTQLHNVISNQKLNKLTLEELSFLCNMSVSTFKRNFFKHYNCSPMKWFHDQRLEHAALQLSTQNKRAIDLYEEAGYDNYSNFVQAFKKKFGTTPKKYKR